MLQIGSLEEAQAALGRNLTLAEKLWYNYSAEKSDYFLYNHASLFFFLVFSLVPLPWVLVELCWFDKMDKFKLQPRIKRSFPELLKCYKDVVNQFFLVGVPLIAASFPAMKSIGLITLSKIYREANSFRDALAKAGISRNEFFKASWRYYPDLFILFALVQAAFVLWLALFYGKPQTTMSSLLWIGIRTSLPLPSKWEVIIQMVVYFLIEDYGNYWIHRLLHSQWGYENIHYMHHEYSTPIGFAAPYAHWAEILILGLPTFLGPALVPCHMITLWLWTILRQAEAIETHSGYNFPWSPTKFIPFYGGAEYHDYHHYVGGQSQSNFASVFTYCDYIYGTDKGYRHHKRAVKKLKGQVKKPLE